MGLRHEAGVTIDGMGVPALSHYLQDERFPDAENLLLRGGLGARIVSSNEFEQNFVCGFPANLIDVQFSLFFRENGIDAPIKFVFVEAGIVNAMAGACKDFELVVVTIWTLVEISKGAMIATSSKSFANIFSGKNPSPLSKVDISLTRPKALQAFFNAPWPDQKSDLAHVVTSIAQLFVAFHELGHIVNGHIRLRYGPAGMISEAKTEIELDERLTSRTLEFDADAFAIQHTLISIAKMKSRFPENIISTLVGDACSVVRIVSASISVALACLQANSWRDGCDLDFLPDTHSPSTLRTLNALAQCINVAEKSFDAAGLADDSFQTAVLQGFTAVEMSISEKTNAGFDFKNFTDWAKVSISHNEQVLRRWADLRPDLTKIKYGAAELAPAQF